MSTHRLGVNGMSSQNKQYVGLRRKPKPKGNKKRGKKK